MGNEGAVCTPDSDVSGVSGSDGNDFVLSVDNNCDGLGDGQGDGKRGRSSRPELFVKGWVANGSKESRRGERVIGVNPAWTRL